MIEHKVLDVFGARMDSYGLDVPKDGDPAAGGMRVDREVNHRLVKQHLQGDLGLGIYPTWHDKDTGELMASWGCCDIDTGDWNEAYSLGTALRAMGMVPHIERSRSKGWHLWVFPETPVTAKQMRRSLKVAYAAIDLPAKEANPKSETLRPDQVGNYVRLPYKGKLGQPSKIGDRQVFMAGWNAESEGEPVGLTDWFYQFDSSFQTKPSVIEQWAARWREPKRAEVSGSLKRYTDEQIKSLLGTLRGDLFLFAKNGPKSDRSAGMVALAYKLRQAGYTSTESFNILCVADEHWGRQILQPGRRSPRQVHHRNHRKGIRMMNGTVLQFGYVDARPTWLPPENYIGAAWYARVRTTEDDFLIFHARSRRRLRKLLRQFGYMQ